MKVKQNVFRQTETEKICHQQTRNFKEVLQAYKKIIKNGKLDLCKGKKSSGNKGKKGRGKKGQIEETENKYEDGRLKPHPIDNYINCKQDKHSN